MDYILARQVAHAENLSVGMQKKVWATQDKWARRTLAGRDDLIDDLQKKAVNNDELIASWAKSNKRSSGLIEIAIKNAVSEHSIVALTSMPQLNLEQVKKLAKKCTPVIGWMLLEKQDVDEEIAASLVASYVANLNQQDMPGKVFTDKLRDKPKLLSAAASAIGWDQIGVLLIIVDEAHRYPELIDEVIETFKRLESVNGGDERASKTIHRCSERLLRSSELTKNQLTELAKLKEFSGIKLDLIERIEADLAQAKIELTCAPNKSKTNSKNDDVNLRHLDIITRFAKHNEVATPYQVVIESVIHHDFLQAGVFQSIIKTTGGTTSRKIVEEFAKAGKIEEILKITDVMGTVVIDDLDNEMKKMVLSAIAKDPKRSLTDREIPTSLLKEITAEYRPLCEIIMQPKLLTEAIKEIEQLDGESAEVALGLLPEWLGDLESLLKASQTLR
jgi:hypothetical protein